MPTPPSTVRLWRPDWPCPAGAVLRVHKRGGGDPTYRIDDDGTHWRGVRTPDGTAALRVRARPALGEIEAEAWGSGRDWLLGHVPALLGADDDWSDFRDQHPLVEQARRRHPHWRISRSDLVLESFVPAVIEQKVTGQEAFAGFRRLVRRFGEPAPGPRDDLFVQPDAATLRGLASWEWLNLHIDGARSRPIALAARRASALERIAGVDGAEADRRLRALPGVGVWTSAEVRSRVLGDPDAVSFGDYHIAKGIGWAFTGKPVDDAGMAVLLEPWRGHRYRVQALLGMNGAHLPRRGPRMAPRTHLPVGPSYR